MQATSLKLDLGRDRASHNLTKRQNFVKNVAPKKQQPRSVNFLVQPRQNNLLTPDHPLFQSAIHNLQLYQRPNRQQQKHSATHPTPAITVAKRPVTQIEQHNQHFSFSSPPQLPDDQQEDASKKQSIVQKNSADCSENYQASAPNRNKIIFQKGIDEQPTDDHQVDFNGNQIPQRQAKIRNSSRNSSLKEDSFQKSSTVKLPFQYRQMKQNVTQKIKMRSQFASGSRNKRLTVHGAQASMQKKPFNKLMESLALKQTQLMSGIQASIEQKKIIKQRAETGVTDEIETLVL